MRSALTGNVSFFQLLPEGVMVGSKLFIASLSEK